MAFFRVTQLLMKLVGHDGIDGFYGEAVCNHIITQKLSKQAQALETALEPALMPARAYETEQSAAGRVGCLVYFRVDIDRRRQLYLPAPYRDELRFILDGLNLDRELIEADNNLPGSGGEIEVKRFDFAGVARCTVTTPGAGLPGRLAELERELRSDNYALSPVLRGPGKTMVRRGRGAVAECRIQPRRPAAGLVRGRWPAHAETLCRSGLRRHEDLFRPRTRSAGAGQAGLGAEKQV